MYTVYYAEYDSPEETRTGMVSAPSESVAHRIAEMQFTNSTIKKIMQLVPPGDRIKFPGARFFKGEFRPVIHQDDLM